MAASSKGPIPLRVTVAVVLIGLAAAWNAGNVGPVASEISREFDVSLAVVGILAGTLFLGSNVVGLTVAAQIGERIGSRRGLRLATWLLIVGNLLFAVSPIFVGLVVGRILPGLGFALAATLGAVWARNAGGVRLVGMFGASIQLGIALALLLGSALSDLGVDWRVGFAITAALGAAALISLPPRIEEPEAAELPEGTRFLPLAARRVRVYRLALLFISIYGVPMVLSAWLIEYLSREGDVATSLAGALAFVLFGLSAAVRIHGAQLQARGVPHLALGGALALAAIGMAALALDPVAAVSFGAVVLLALGFGIPYATALVEAQDLYPQAPSEPMALMTLVGVIPPIVVIPLIGHAIARGDGDLAFGLLAGYLVIATLANLKRSGIPLAPTAPERR